MILRSHRSFADAGLAISPDCRTALYSQRDQSGSDIFLVDLR